jgi:hypothetical protein
MIYMWFWYVLGAFWHLQLVPVGELSRASHLGHGQVSKQDISSDRFATRNCSKLPETVEISSRLLLRSSLCGASGKMMKNENMARHVAPCRANCHGYCHGFSRESSGFGRSFHVFINPRSSWVLSWSSHPHVRDVDSLSKRCCGIPLPGSSLISRRYIFR